MNSFCIFLLTMLISSNVFADASTCKTVDIRDKNPKLKKFLSNPRNQDSIGWCYGFAAADLLSVKVSEPVSSFHMSAIYNKEVAYKFSFSKSNYKAKGLNEVYASGNTAVALKRSIAQKYICSEKSLPFDFEYSNQVYETIRHVELLKEHFKNNEGKDSSDCKKCEELKLLATYPYFQGSSFEELSKVLTAKNLNIALEEFIAAKCKNKIKIPNIIIAEIDKSKKENFLKNIEDTLVSGKPLSIMYDVKNITKMNGNHVSVLIGKRWKNSKCEYNIRNSWGASCAFYKENIECNRDEGSFWVSEDVFYEMANNVNYISN